MIQDFAATLTEKHELAPQVWYLTFALPEGVRLDFSAGQYVILKVGDDMRQYSIASRDTWHNKFELWVELIPKGIGSTFLCNLPVGGEAMFKGPAGVFTLKDTPKNKIFLATGTGIAPVKSMIESYFEKPAPQLSTLALFFGEKHRTGIYLYDTFARYANEHENFNFKMCLSQEQDVAGLDGAHFVTGRMNGHVEAFF